VCARVRACVRACGRAGVRVVSREYFSKNGVVKQAVEQHQVTVVCVRELVCVSVTHTHTHTHTHTPRHTFPCVCVGHGPRSNFRVSELCAHTNSHSVAAS
jgi:hypothetical protein